MTPCLNRVNLIREAIESVLAQDYLNFEHIVIDGGSTDGTLDVLREYPHLKLISEPDNGLYDAVNKGIRLAQGELIGWLNSDDVYDLGVFHEVARRFRENPAVNLICGNATIFETGHSGSRKTVRTKHTCQENCFNLRVLENSRTQINPLFITRRLYKAVGEYNVKYPTCADRDFLIRLALRQPSMFHVGCYVYHSRFHEGSLTFTRTGVAKRRLFSENAEIAHTWLSKTGIPEKVRLYCQEMYSKACFVLAQMDARDEQWLAALRWMWQGFRLAPMSMARRTLLWVSRRKWLKT